MISISKEGHVKCVFFLFLHLHHRRMGIKTRLNTIFFVFPIFCRVVVYELTMLLLQLSQAESALYL